MAEVHDALHHTRLSVLDDPTEILQLQVGDAHVAHDAFLLQLVQGGQGLVDHLLQSSLHASLKLDVVYINNINVVDVQTLQTLVDALLGALSRIVPCVVTVLAITSYLR